MKKSTPNLIKYKIPALVFAFQLLSLLFGCFAFLSSNGNVSNNCVLSIQRSMDESKIDYMQTKLFLEDKKDTKSLISIIKEYEEKLQFSYRSEFAFFITTDKNIPTEFSMDNINYSKYDSSPIIIPKDCSSKSNNLEYWLPIQKTIQLSNCDWLLSEHPMYISEVFANLLCEKLKTSINELIGENIYIKRGETITKHSIANIFSNTTAFSKQYTKEGGDFFVISNGIIPSNENCHLNLWIKNDFVALNDFIYFVKKIQPAHLEIRDPTGNNQNLYDEFLESVLNKKDSLILIILFIALSGITLILSFCLILKKMDKKLIKLIIIIPLVYLCFSSLSYFIFWKNILLMSAFNVYNNFICLSYIGVCIINWLKNYEKNKANIEH